MGKEKTEHLEVIYMKRPMPVGYEEFGEIRKKHFYYVDKTRMIRELLDRGGKVNLFTRPRRFGKTLNLSMLRRFFELERDEEGNLIDHRELFEGLEISSCEEAYLVRQQAYPVINLTMKSAKQPDFEMAYASLIDEIAKEYRRHAYVLHTDHLLDSEKDRFESVMNRKAERIDYAKSLEFLSYCLSRYEGKQVIILIDEYDVPLENAYFEGFYKEMTGFVRSLFESALKTNPYLEFAVITGCLRISRESIFTGLNNLDIFSVLSPDFSDSFGFTETELKKILLDYGMEQKFSEIKAWYDGYLFGEEEIYNPWSIINYVKTAEKKIDAFPKPYWSNTSSNSIIKEVIEAADMETRHDIEELIAGKAIEKPIHEDITYEDIRESKDNLWNFLFFTGYLKKTKECFRDGTLYFQLSIPNAEIRSIYQNTILTWMEKKLRKTDTAPFVNALKEGDCEKASTFLTEQLLDTISFYDYSEQYYHGFLAGLLKTADQCRVYSNRESGTGRPDLILKTSTLRRGWAMILELKVAKRYDQMNELCLQALSQIKEQNYEAALKEEGYSDIKKYGICFFKKECLIVKAE